MLAALNASPRYVFNFTHSLYYFDGAQLSRLTSDDVVLAQVHRFVGDSGLLPAADPEFKWRKYVDELGRTQVVMSPIHSCGTVYGPHSPLDAEMVSGFTMPDGTALHFSEFRAGPTAQNAVSVLHIGVVVPATIHTEEVARTAAIRRSVPAVLPAAETPTPMEASTSDAQRDIEATCSALALRVCPTIGGMAKLELLQQHASFLVTKHKLTLEEATLRLSEAYERARETLAERSNDHSSNLFDIRRARRELRWNARESWCQIGANFLERRLGMYTAARNWAWWMRFVGRWLTSAAPSNRLE
jgi:hypothetical protein